MLTIVTTMANIFNRVIRTDLQIKKIEKWVTSQDFQLVKGKHLNDEVYVDKKVLFLSTRQNLISQMFSLLHECGHMIIRLNKKRFGKEFPFLILYEEKKLHKFPLRFHMEEVKEEIEAWDKGYELAEKLGIPLSNREYYKFASRWVLRYMALATVDKKWLIR